MNSVLRLTPRFTSMTTRQQQARFYASSSPKIGAGRGG